MLPSLRRLIALVLGVSYALELTGCTGWSAKREAPGAVVAKNPDKRYRITQTDSVRVELRRVTLRGDTLFGYRPPRPGDPPEAVVSLDGEKGVAMGIPTEEISKLEVHQVDAGRTIILVAVGVGVTAAIVAAVASYSYEMDLFQNTPTTSCPLVYSWDGHEWHLDSGTFAGAIMPALQRSDLDELAHAVPVQDTLHLRVTGLSGETEFVDELTLLAVDHPSGLSVAPDGRADGTLHTLGQVLSPISARDDAGRDMTRALARVDGSYWESPLETRNPDDVRDGVELTFHRPPGERELKLVVDGQNTPWAGYLVRRLVRAAGRDVLAWYDPGRTVAAARELAPVLAAEASLSVSVRRDGAWQPVGRFWEVGPELGKRQVLPIELGGITGETVRVRLESAPSFWVLDRVGADFSDDAPVTLTALPIARMEMRGANDPIALVQATDHEYLTLEPDQAAELVVPVPASRSGTTRTFLLRSSGWYRVHGAETAPPDAKLLAQLRDPGPYPASRAAVSLMNEALAALQP